MDSPITWEDIVNVGLIYTFIAVGFFLAGRFLGGKRRD